MGKRHIVIVLLISLLCSGCSSIKKKTVRKQRVESILEEEKKQVVIPTKKAKKTNLPKKWLTKCSVILVEEHDCSSQLKSIANAIGVTLNIKKDIKVNYKAKNQPFIDVLLAICNKLDLMIMINGLNADVEPDSPYLHNFSLGNLPSSIGTEFSTLVDHSFGDSTKGNISKNTYKNTNSYYDGISQNLSILLPKPSLFTINTQAGIISVLATQKQQKKVSKYLNSIKRKLNDQVLVEAKLLEVELFEEKTFGVDLSLMKKAFSEEFKIISPLSFSNVTNSNVLTFSSKITEEALKNFVLSFVSNYGKASSISNPYLLISNNHVGIFKAVENKIYFKFKSETILNSGNVSGVATNKQSEFVTYPVGVTFSVHVTKLDNDLIKLYIKPTITEVSKEIEDASYKFVSSSDSKSIPKVPLIKTREMESVLVLRNGQYAIIGGLIDRNITNENQLLRKSHNTKKTELIILLKVQTVDNDEKEDLYDILLETH